MIHDDLFADFDRQANLNGWNFLGEPERLTRRYGKDGTMVRVYANHAGTALSRVTRIHDGRVRDTLGTRVPEKRTRALRWLRGVE